MGQILNQYSALWTALGLVILISLLVFRQKPKPTSLLALFAVIAGLGAAWVFLRPTQTPAAQDAHAVQAMIGQGKPVLLEFQSPY